MRPEKLDMKSMSVTEVDERTAHWTDMLEMIERRRSGMTKVAAREAIARRIGVAPGTLENLERGRSKGIRAWIAERVRVAVIRELEREISRLQHDLEIARQSGARLDSPQVQQAFSALDAARTLIKQAAA
jgi:transcriptional regulator with XRE-family HTH domain